MQQGADLPSGLRDVLVFMLALRKAEVKNAFHAEKSDA